MLRTWHKAAKAQAFARVRKTLEGRLLLAKPDFCYSILDLQAKVNGKLRRELVSDGFLEESLCLILQSCFY